LSEREAGSGGHQGKQSRCLHALSYRKVIALVGVVGMECILDACFFWKRGVVGDWTEWRERKGMRTGVGKRYIHGST